MSEIGFKYSILASGSTGNCFYIETPQKRLLIDAGLTGKKVTSLLAEINRKPEDLDAILVTHEHSDHIKGCLLYTSPSPRDRQKSRMPSSA